jgi:hypothetical protein
MVYTKIFLLYPKQPIAEIKKRLKTYVSYISSHEIRSG